MIEHHGGALQMAHEARQNSSQRKEIIELRKMLQIGGLNNAVYYKFDSLFAL